MDFDEIYKSIKLTEEAILELVDEYTLYCYYSKIPNLIPGFVYAAPYRDDAKPSFSVFYSKKYTKVDFMWKDHATGESGTIFQLVQRIEQLNDIQEAYAKINHDFALGFNTPTPTPKEKLVLYQKPEKSLIKLRIADRPLSPLGRRFWEPLRIEEALLNKHATCQVQYHWSYAGQAAPTTAPDPTFAYRIGAYYQLYSPYAPREFKFRNDLPENYFFGYLQLPERGSKLVIDKSNKDVIFCDRLGYPAVAPKSETTMIPHKKMLELKERFDEIFLTFDPDDAGRSQTEKYLAYYPWLKPRFLSQAKDKTDLCNSVGYDQAEIIIKQLLL